MPQQHFPAVFFGSNVGNFDVLPHWKSVLNVQILTETLKQVTITGSCIVVYHCEGYLSRGCLEIACDPMPTNN